MFSTRRLFDIVSFYTLSFDEKTFAVKSHTTYLNEHILLLHVHFLIGLNIKYLSTLVTIVTVLTSV